MKQKDDDLSLIKMRIKVAHSESRLSRMLSGFQKILNPEE